MAAIYIEWNGKDILACKKSIIEALRLQIEDIIMDNDIQLNEDFAELMGKLDQAGNGFGFDLAECLHTKEDILMFTDLVRKGIDRYNQERQDDLQSARDLMEGFYKELVKMGESFPGNVILKCKERIIRILHLGTEYLKIENNITLNENLTKIMENLDRTSSRFGLDLKEYLHTKEDFIAFIDLTRRAIDKYNQRCQDAQQTARDLLEGFYQELVKIGESFPG